MTSKQRQKDRQHAAKTFASMVIVTTIFIQAYTAFLRRVCSSTPIPIFCSLPEDPNIYPFLNYPMYSTVKQEGVTVPQYRLIAIFDDGSEKQLQPEDFNLSRYWFNTHVLKAFQAQQGAKINAYVSAYEEAGNRPFVAVRFENNRLKITREAVVPGSPDTSIINFPITVSEALDNE